MCRQRPVAGCLSLFIICSVLTTIIIYNDLDINLTLGKSRMTSTANKNDNQQSSADVTKVLLDLENNSFPNTAYFVLCENRFLFRHYLSVMGVIRQFRADNIVMFFGPPLQNDTYNTWLDEIKQAQPFFVARQMNEKERPHGCVDTDQFVNNLLKNGGIYVDINTLIGGFPIGFRHMDLVIGLDANGKRTLVMKKPGIDIPSVSSTIEQSKTRLQLKCSSNVGNVTGNENEPSCIVMDTKNRLFPRDIWERNDLFGQLARAAFYGRSEIAIPVPSFDELIPNIAHMVWPAWNNKTEMKFLFYLSVMSLISVAKVDMVYIHGEKPTGKFWDLAEKTGKVAHIYRHTFNSVYGQTLGEQFGEHLSDIWRPDILFKYGGIYIDTDVIMTKPLDKNIRGYEAVICLDPDQPPHFPESVQNAIMFGKRGARFWQLFTETLKTFDPKHMIYNSCHMPYKVKERHPELLLIDLHQQVFCFRNHCHPSWLKPFPDWGSRRPINISWKDEVYAFHFGHPTNPALWSIDNLLTDKNKNIYTTLGINVLTKSNMFEYFMDLLRKNATAGFPSRIPN